MTEEEKILMHQLLDTITLFLNRPESVDGAKRRVLAQQYLFVDDYRDNPHTMLRICEHFDINPVRLRKQLLEAQLGEISNFDYLIGKTIEDNYRVKQSSEIVRELLPVESEKLEKLIRRKLHGRRFGENKKQSKRKERTSRRGLQEKDKIQAHQEQQK